MSLNLFNTLSRTVEPFVPIDPDGRHVRLYCCGPTVHDFAHIGNFRTFVFADLVRRYLEFRGYEVRHVMNITDVEDKIIKRVRETGVSLRDYTEIYETAFLEDLRTLHCKTPTDLPRATDHVQEIVTLIERLVERGLAYQAADGSLYFSIEKYQGCGCRYGQLVKLNFDQMRLGERVSQDEYDKQSLADFALWKARVPEDGDVFWKSPWGPGRPGWHIECSAMSMKLLGPSFDLHLGGEDLAFPHHEDEIAQSEGAGLQAPGERFVKYWMHGAHLLVEGKKMSKSLGNFFTIRDLVNKGFRGEEIRYLLLTAHYRETFNFTLEGLDGARSALGRINECQAKLAEIGGNPDDTTAPNAGILQEITAVMDEDLNVSAAWGIIHRWTRDLNRHLAYNDVTPPQATAARATWKRLAEVFGIPYVAFGGASAVGLSSASAIGAAMEKGGTEIPAECLSLLGERQAARQAKDFKRSDAIRDELKAKGWVIEDTSRGPRLKRL